jgi:RNA polymerase sigma-70 factor, ECF subfamily
MTTSSDDRAAFSELFERHRHGIHAYLLGRTSDAEAASDLLQETFLRAWRAVGQLTPLESDRQRAWLFTVARNLVVDRYRQRATRHATITALVHEHDGEEDSDTAEQVVARDQLAQLDRALAALPDRQRTILTMATVADMTSREIGEALDLPAGTVRYELHQTRARLARQLKG